MKHVPDMVIHLSFIILGPSFQRVSVRKHGVPRLAELRVDSCQCSCCAFGLRSTEAWRGICLCLGSLCRPQYPPDIIETLCLAGAALQVVRWSSIKEGKVGNE
jgi:hypothetical protein